MVGDGAFVPIYELPRLPDSWKWGRLGDLVDRSRGICYGIVQPGKHDETGVPMVNSQDVFNGSVASLIEFRVAKELHERFKRSTIRGGEILLTLVGANFGRVAIAPNEFAGFNCSRAVGIIPVRENTQFMMFCLRSPLARRFMDNWANTTAQPTFNLKEVSNLPVPLPPIPEQKAIAHILGTLDDMIVLNRQMNATLEAMARVLFQSWFVDFDPVRAKLDGRKPTGLDTATAALFPAHFQDSPLGHIPQGWEVRSLDQIANFLNGLALQKYPPGDDATLPVIKIAQLRKGDSAGADRCNTELAPQYIVEDGDVLFSWSGSLEVELWCGGQGALNQHLFKVTSPEFPKWFCYLWTLYHLDEFRLIAAGKATTMGHIQRGHLTAAKALVPPPALLKSMTHIMAPLIDQIIANRTQSRTLATLRDALLPKLITGELRIPFSVPDYRAQSLSSF